jgi:thymidylate synthase (FAD)
MKIAKQEVTLLDSCGSDLSVVNAARVSFSKQSSWCNVGEYEHDGGDLELADKDAKLINYLAKHKHKSPFNHCFMSFRVKAPIFVARQLVKHEYLPWNEVSRRYVTDEPEFYIPDGWRMSADNVKQGSGGLLVDQGTQKEIALMTTQYSLDAYNTLMRNNVCAEQARMVLPQNTMTEWIWSGTLFAFAKMCKLRLDPHTQKETQEIAQLISNEAKELYPTSWAALMEYGE